jgi:hypothetical protein
VGLDKLNSAGPIRSSSCCRDTSRLTEERIECHKAARYNTGSANFFDDHCQKDMTFRGGSGALPEEHPDDAKNVSSQTAQLDFMIDHLTSRSA